ncbi:MAG TPA: SDR family NAD(P)-dependent oxidoreductase [Nocardioidaceae bacterium]|nr:SDR family NAD(P)-dependent oxidoreductase [Nocardioidaceae bacterium]
MTLVADVVDRALEVAIAPSFTRIGYAARSRLYRWTRLDSYDLTGRVVVVTGATSGLGLAAARTLAADGATLVLVARNEEKARGVRDGLLDSGARGGVDIVIADTGDLDAVRRAGAALAERHGQVDALVHAAGALDEAYAATPQGMEQTVASQVVGPFLMTQLLVPLLQPAPYARVVWVASGGMYSEPLSVDDLEMDPRNYNGTRAYARAKRAQVTLAELWADRLRPEHIAVHSMHPGWADTPGVRRSLPTFRRIVGPLLRTPAEGADTIVWLVADDGLPVRTTGLFWHDRRDRPVHRLPSTRRSDTPAERQRLWDWCVDRASWTAGPR